MSKAMILRAIVAVAIIVGGILVIMEDEPEPPTSDVNSVEPFPKQDEP